MSHPVHTVRGKRILLVDDELGVRESLRLLLLRDAHEVVEANNGAEAFTLFRQTRFDLVVTDFEMPFLKGNELAVRIKRIAPQQPILMITAFGHRRAEDNPVDAVLAKPLDALQLREIMVRLLQQPGEDQRAEAVRERRYASKRSAGDTEVIVTTRG
jgi:YesN/AraC family two-component response regulator